MILLTGSQGRRNGTCPSYRRRNGIETRDAGRITQYMARTVRKVYASDVSSDQIAIARRHCDPQVVRFYLTEGANLPVPDESVSAVFSVYVFQVFDKCSDGADYFREIYRVLIPEKSTIMVHLPIHFWPSGGLLLRLFERVYATKRALGNLRAAQQRFWIEHGKFRPLRRTLNYEARWLLDTLESLGFIDVELRMFRLTSNTDPHTFVFARKGPEPKGADVGSR